MKKIINILAIMILICPAIISGQNQLKTDTVVLRSSEEATADAYSSVNLPQLVPVSPNAASLGIYGAIPVGHYTGVPNISIPVYEIDLDGKKFPVNISYHASGIKVAQEASSIGLGWALNAGGCITKEVRGWDDFALAGQNNPMGYYYDTAMPAPDANNNINVANFNIDQLKYFDYYNNGTDPEPDLFHFNFATFSGTMFFKKYSSPGNTYTVAKAVIQKESAYLDATLYISGNNNTHWILSDGDGFKYYFNTHELSEMYSYQSPIYSSNSRNSCNRRLLQPVVETAWYLDSIVSPNKHKYQSQINLNYLLSLRPLWDE